jgi:glycerol-3-phosphate dehydrogenase
VTEKKQRRALDRVRRALAKAGLGEAVTAAPFRSSVRLTGRVMSWEDKVAAGFAAASRGFVAVINDIGVQGVREESEPRMPQLRDRVLEGRHFDVLVIGGGVTGCALARELSRYELSVALLEKESDLALHASGRNDGMVHPGFAAAPGTLKAELNVRGNRMYDRLCRELGIGFRRPGSMILFPSPFYRLLLPLMRRRAKKNGVDGYRFISRKEVARMEPWISGNQHGAFFFPSAGVLSPYRLVTALAEDAVENGVELFLECGVTGFGMSGEGDLVRQVKTNRGSCSARVVVNAAGIWADWIAALADDRFFSLHGRKGVDAILDLKTGVFQKRIAAMPHLIRERGSRTKGGGIVPTIEGNILVGPTAKEVPDRENYDTEPSDLEDLFTRLSVNSRLDPGQVITYFAGIRACSWEEDFIIRCSDRVANLIHLAGIQSPGLASAPAIAEEAVKLCERLLGGGSDEAESFHSSESSAAAGGFRVEGSHNSSGGSGAEASAGSSAPASPAGEAPKKLRRKQTRPLRQPVQPAEMTDQERDNLIRSDGAYGRIVCRCEGVSEGEIRDALHRPVPAGTLDGIKRRTRAGTGRCQGGFCTPRVMEIMSRELGIGMEEITKKGGGSRILYRETKKGGPV